MAGDRCRNDWGGKGKEMEANTSNATVSAALGIIRISPTTDETFFFFF